jgi:hypothetical protein
VRIDAAQKRILLAFSQLSLRLLGKLLSKLLGKLLGKLHGAFPQMKDRVAVSCRCGSKSPELPSHNILAKVCNLIRISFEDISHVIGAEKAAQFQGCTSGLMLPAYASSCRRPWAE